MAGKTVGILGAGVGGIVVANTLRRSLSSSACSIALIDRHPDHYFPSSYLWAINGRRTLEDLHRPLASLRRKHIEVVTGEIEAIDPSCRSVTVDGAKGEFDHLVVALGADLAHGAIPGLAECHTFYTFDGVARLREAIESFAGGPILIVITGTPYRCPDAPYEAAFLLDEVLRRRGLRPKSTIELVTVEPELMPVAGISVATAISRLLAERDVKYTPGTRLINVNHKRRLATFTDGTQRPFELIIVVPPLVVPKVVELSGLKSATGWISAGPMTLQTMYEYVYAIGDVTSVLLANNTYLPKLGVFARQEAEVVAHNIAAAIEGGDVEERYYGFAGCFLETGGGRAAGLTGDFYAKPAPKVKLSRPTRRRHWAKVWYTRSWWNNWL